MDNLMHEGNIQSSETEPVSSSLWRDAWIKLSKNRLAIFGLFILLTLSEVIQESV